MERLSTWQSRWEEGRIGFHKTEVNQNLLQFSSTLDLNTRKRVFIPLCGKALDLIWFYEGGHEVIGVEGIEKAVVELFGENKLPYSIKELSWGKIYETNDHRLKIYVCDIFNLDTEEIGKFNVFWDRGSLVAINIEDRERYAELMKRLLDKDFKYLLDTVQYEGIDVKGGPPRCIPHELTANLFGDVCNIELLKCEDESDERTRNVFGKKEFFESVHLLTPKL